ncbi:transglycosylase SLT domain-containing protein [Paraburkholderia sp. EG287A]|uniref:transglycosylase SLT domain-containing protein n=1 Tax=Paraburkholderia sp. EG287A TaxID=3237012 RepID=UPI0034D353B8
MAAGVAVGAMLALGLPTGGPQLRNAMTPAETPVFTTLSPNSAPRNVALADAGKEPAAHLTPGWNRTVSTYLAGEWNLASGYAQTVASAVARASRRYGVDPALLLAIAAAESSLHNIGNPDGGSDPMEPYGIMQVAGRWHRDKFPNGEVVRTDVTQNILIGASVLREYLDLEDGDLRRALRRYNGSVDDRYFIKVKTLRRRINSALPDSNI